MAAKRKSCTKKISAPMAAPARLDGGEGSTGGACRKNSRKRRKNAAAGKKSCGKEAATRVLGGK